MTIRGTAMAPARRPRNRRASAPRLPPRPVPPGIRWLPGQQFDKRPEQRRIAIGHPSRRGEVFRAAAFDHVARNGKRRPRKADQRRPKAFGRDPGARPAHRLQHRGDGSAQAAPDGAPPGRLRHQLRQHRPLALLVVQPVAQRPRQDQDVAEQDRARRSRTGVPVGASPSCQLRRGGEGEKVTRLSPHTPDTPADTGPPAS